MTSPEKFLYSVKGMGCIGKQFFIIQLSEQKLISFQIKFYVFGIEFPLL